MHDEHFSWAAVREAFKDPNCWLYGLGFHTMSLPLYTLSLFLVSKALFSNKNISLTVSHHLANHYQESGLYGRYRTTADGASVCFCLSHNNLHSHSFGKARSARYVYWRIFSVWRDWLLHPAG